MGLVKKDRLQTLRPAGLSHEVIGLNDDKRLQSIVGTSELFTASDPTDWSEREYILSHPKIFSADTRSRIRHVDCGSAFSSTACTYWDTSVYMILDASTKTIPRTYHGWLDAKQDGAIPGSIIWPTCVPLSNPQMYALGSSAIARTLPKNPVANCFVSMRELLKDGVPKVPLVHTLKERTSYFRKLQQLGGQEYLNVEFGWAPFIGDVHNLARAAANSHSILSQYERDAGRNVRRSYKFPLITSDSTTTSMGSTQPPLTSQISPAYGLFPLEKRVRRTQSSWFSGCFTYWLRRSDSVIGQMARIAQEANKLLGVEPTPDNVWKSQPWTWGLDWASNVGDVIHNICALQDDSQVLRYGYLMTYTSSEDTYTLRTSGTKLGRDLIQMFGRYDKRRVKATPYGFGLDQTLFTPSRLAIIAALGITFSSERR